VKAGPARILRSVLWRTGSACQKLAARIPVASDKLKIPVEILERQDNWVLCRIDDFVWRLDPSQCIDGDLLDDGLFEPASTNWVRRIVKPGMVAIDVGANFGYYTMQLSRLVGPDGLVHAFEPSARYHPRLLDHIERNGCRNVIVSEYGLSDRFHEEPLYGDNVSATMHWPDDARPPEIEETIRLRTLDNYAKEASLSRLDFIKVDIDGHEPGFVTGAIETLKKFRPIILMEFSQVSLVMAGSDVERLGQQLTEIGYALHSEQTGEPYASRLDFLRDAMNCTHSVNVICYPATARQV
jgi:FkbM family methyltransferase